MSKDGDQALRTLYANLMDEVKVRIDYIDRAANGQTRFATPIVREFCWLQLRFLCELISLACLVAHGDIPAAYSKRMLGREWSADAIVKGLQKLRPHFYPEAIQRTSVEPYKGVRRHNVEGMKQQPFPKEALLDLYGQTHKHLHRGNVQKLLSANRPLDMQINVPEIISWAQRITDHLTAHIIGITEGKVIICMLRNPGDNNKVLVVSAESDEKSP